MGSFFNKMKAGIEQGASTIGSKSKEMMDTAKVKREIDGFKKDKADTFGKLGELVYGMMKGEGLDEETIKQKCEEVDVLETKIAEKEVELTQIQKRGT